LALAKYLQHRHNLAMKETIGVRAEQEVVAAIRKVAAQQNRTLSNMAGVALQEWAAARGLVRLERQATQVGAER
jgi:hypothetical protein